MTEAELKAKLVLKLRTQHKNYVVLRHEDRFRVGIPDMSVTGNKITSWWEAKYANPHVRSRGAQELAMLRLGRAGIAYYIIYHEEGGIRRTGIVHPGEIKTLAGAWVEGFDHQFVIDFIMRIHE